MSRDTETELSQGRFSDMSSAGSAGKDKAAQYDYCMVLPSKDGELTEKGKLKYVFIVLLLMCLFFCLI